MADNGPNDGLPVDCTHCAACCFSESPRHARVTGDDHRRLGDDAERLVLWIGNEAYMRLEPVNDALHAPVNGPLHRCAALTIDPLTGTFACSIYETRPDVCRDLARGSGACRGEIDAKKERPKRALAVLRGADGLRR